MCVRVCVVSSQDEQWRGELLREKLQQHEDELKVNQSLVVMLKLLYSSILRLVIMMYVVIILIHIKIGYYVIVIMLIPIKIGYYVIVIIILIPIKIGYYVIVIILIHIKIRL